jgi:hypothetical protein
MSTWFSGDQEHIYKRMSILTGLLDGEGYVRDSGSHGQRGYTGKEYRFNFIGATTPLNPRAWRIMSDVGSRVLFHEIQGQSDMDAVMDDVIGGSEYTEKVARCRELIQKFLRQLWERFGGFAGVKWSSGADGHTKSLLRYLTRLIQYGRADLGNDGGVNREGAHRIADSLYAIARGHALLNGRDSLTVEDFSVCARIALSTIPEKRRRMLRELLNPTNGGRLSSRQAETSASVSRPTAHDRMEELATLGLAGLSESDDDGRGTKQLELFPDFEWPGSLDFPEFRS